MENTPKVGFVLGDVHKIEKEYYLILHDDVVEIM